MSISPIQDRTMSERHSPRCLWLVERGKCTCYLSINEEFFESKLPVFQPATKEGPVDPKAHPDDTAWDAIREYVARYQRDTRVIDQELSSQSPYTPLRDNEIRILELKGGNFVDPLCGSLHLVNIDFTYRLINHDKRTTNHAISLSERGPFWYTALSYTWGAPVFDVQFTFENGTSIQITRTLASALKYLRNPIDSIFLWIDQICIHQEDVADRQKQIPLMGLIYSHATNTVIWLGEGGEDDPQLAFDTLQTLHSRLALFNGEINPDDLARLDLPALTDPEWAEVISLLSRPWFERLWVVQEVCLSVNPYVKCGNAVVAWDDFSVWCTTAESCGLRALLEGITPRHRPQSGLYTVSELSAFRSYIHSQETPSSLLDALVLTRYAQASVAKDKVYGILGFASAMSTSNKLNDMATAPIVPRYGEEVSARDVFLEASIGELWSELFRVLSCVDHDDPASPSWIPDWTSPRVTDPLGYSTKSWSCYSSGGPFFSLDSGKPNRISYTLGDYNRSVTIPGMEFDSIEIIGEPIDEEPFSFIGENCLRGTPAWVNCLSMLNTITSYPTHEAPWDAFWKTMVAGKNGTSYGNAPQEYSEILSLVVDECMGKEQHIAGQPYSPRRQKGFFTLKSLKSRKPKQTLDELKKAMHSALHWRAFAVTKKGYFCLAPRSAQVGDEVAIFQAGPVPFILRRRGITTKAEFQLIGETYVHGVMKGEAFESDSVKLDSITLI